ncbi:MAG: hypothetical protein U0904_01375 [Candidatus Nanopelagicales bacterium]|nr:hypothetical protein [Candidatus Nanopelagicales bacterium]
MNITAKCERADGWWAIRVPDEVPGVFTQARRLDQVAEVAAAAVGSMLAVDPATVRVAVEYDATTESQEVRNQGPDQERCSYEDPDNQIPQGPPVRRSAATATTSPVTGTAATAEPNNAARTNPNHRQEMTMAGERTPEPDAAAPALPAWLAAGGWEWAPYTAVLGEDGADGSIWTQDPCIPGFELDLQCPGSDELTDADRDADCPVGFRPPVAPGG